MPSAALAPLEPREARSVEIGRRLLAYLLSGEVKPGERIPSERQLAEQLGVGRSAIRDAVRPLLLLGVVETRQGDGTYLRRPESSLVPRTVEGGLLLGEHATLDLVEARTYIEVALSELAAQRRTTTDLELIEKQLELMAASGPDRDAFRDADLAFHLAVAQSSGNTVLFGTLDSIQSLLHVWISRVVAAATETRSSYEEHVPIYRAIRDRDSKAAADAMNAHMHSARQRLIDTLDGAAAAGVSTIAEVPFKRGA